MHFTAGESAAGPPSFNWSLSHGTQIGLARFCELLFGFAILYLALFLPPTSIPQRFYHRQASGISSGISLSLPLVLFVVPFFHSVGHHRPLVIVVAFLLFSQVLSVRRKSSQSRTSLSCCPLPAQALSQAL
jgi:hypothetical protein